MVNRSLSAPALLVSAGIVLMTCQPAAPDKPDRRAAISYGSYIVLAWNDLGMHCINPTYDQVMVLPPYNNVWAQVVKRGNPPQIVTDGVTVSYRIDGNTYSYGKGGYSDFWDKVAPKLSATPPAKNIGLTGNGLSGNMKASGGHFEATGIPVVPITDSGAWNPYQVGIITVTDAAGAVLAKTEATIPISDEMHCNKCHGSTDTFQNILSGHNTRFANTGTAPVICASCHADPALGMTGTTGVKSLSQAIHGFHATVTPQPSCYDCHPGPITLCARSTRHSATDGNCTACHGALADVASSQATGRTAWLTEPKCVTCHAGVAEVDTMTALYRSSSGHNGISCPACHGSPHAMLPTNQTPNYPNIDAYQSNQYQGYTTSVKSMGSCGICHRSSRGSGFASFQEEHGARGEQQTGCNMCHTVVPSTTSAVAWPHSYQWNNSATAR